MARILRPPRAVREQRVLGRQYLERKTPQRSACSLPNLRYGEDNPRLGGAVYRREVALPLLPRPHVARILRPTRAMGMTTRAGWGGI